MTYRPVFSRLLLILAGVPAAAAQPPAPTTSAPPQSPAASDSAVIDEAGNEPAPNSVKDPSEPWTLEVHPCIWYVGFSGDLKLPRTVPGSNSSVDIDQLNLTSPRVSPFGEANLRKDRWLISLRGFGFGIDETGSPTESGVLGNIDFAPGDSIRSSLDILGLEALGGYTFFQHKDGELGDNRYKLRFGIDALFGARVLDVDYSGSLIGSTQTAGDQETAFHPVIGARLHADFYEDFSVILELSGGALPLGDDSSYGFDILIGGQWRPIEHVGVQIGYRALFMGVQSGNGDDEFDFSGTGQGLYAGITVSF